MKVKQVLFAAAAVACVGGASAAQLRGATGGSTGGVQVSQPEGKPWKVISDNYGVVEAWAKNKELDKSANTTAEANLNRLMKMDAGIYEPEEPLKSDDSMTGTMEKDESSEAETNSKPVSKEEAKIAATGNEDDERITKEIARDNKEDEEEAKRLGELIDDTPGAATGGATGAATGGATGAATGGTTGAATGGATGAATDEDEEALEDAKLQEEMIKEDPAATGTESDDEASSPEPTMTEEEAAEAEEDAKASAKIDDAIETEELKTEVQEELDDALKKNEEVVDPVAITGTTSDETLEEEVKDAEKDIGPEILKQEAEDKANSKSGAEDVSVSDSEDADDEFKEETVEENKEDRNEEAAEEQEDAAEDQEAEELAAKDSVEHYKELPGEGEEDQETQLGPVDSKEKKDQAGAEEEHATGAEEEHATGATGVGGDKKLGSVDDVDETPQRRASSVVRIPEDEEEE
jgi:hypothetical protein